MMTVMSLVSVMFMPASVISGMGGMNVRIPWQHDMFESHAPFWFIVGIIVLFSTSIFIYVKLVYLKKKKK